MITKTLYKELLTMTARDKVEQGYDLDLEVFDQAVAKAADSLDALDKLADDLLVLPFRKDWPYEEPNDWPCIRAAMGDGAKEGYLASPDLEQADVRVRAAFVASVCGCILGKPIEVRPTLDELKQAFEPLGEWPIRDYVTEACSKALGRWHWTMPYTTRGNITHAFPDDDINYTVLGMVLLEKYGIGLNVENVRQEWGMNIPPFFTWGPERIQIINTALHSVRGGDREITSRWTNTLNPGSELCGAVIRADAYGYACPGNPMLASRLAWVDASFTHLRTGIYATQYVAAVIALCFLLDGTELGNDRLMPFEQALDYIPQNTRFSHIVRDSLERVRCSDDWLEGYGSIHEKYKEYAHCQVYQEIGTLMNTLKFAEDVGDGICKQVCQGNDTDSFGATSGSILGVFFGPGHLEERWTQPLNNEIHTMLADFYEQNLTRLAERMGRLPAHIHEQVEHGQSSATPQDEGGMEAPNEIGS